MSDSAGVLHITHLFIQMHSIYPVKILHNWYRYCLDLIYPLRCLVCSSAISPTDFKSEFLCVSCFKKIKFIPSPVYEKGKLLPDFGGYPRFNDKSKLYFEELSSVAVYEGVWKELIHTFKYKGDDCIDKFLAGLLAEMVLKNLSLKRSDFIVPVPLHWQDRRRRGYNQAELLALQLGRLTGVPVCTKNLVKSKKTPSQTKLSKNQRIRNVKGVFGLKNFQRIKNKKIILVDDVFTTGSTVNECSKVLKEANAAEVNVITLACSL